ncbi:hypothetical protein [uncultured Polaribacter sp.]|uniref:hypothetical protein n=1 Tax=uncultured Polaribacter sp. TaxID=174711 RepID=UPI0026343625|nr:hypothetical protein [uncultured Polaribacter sp.]
MFKFRLFFFKTALVIFIICVNFLSIKSYAQKKVTKSFTTESNKIFINTEGLDNVVLENAETNFLEVILYAENPTQQHIVINQKSYETSINFKLPVVLEKEIIFRKFITERLQRAKAIIRIPENKQVIVYGDNIDVTSKSCKNHLEIYLENGIVKLNHVQANVLLKLYSGNVYASLKNTNVAITSKKGTIEIDKILYTQTFKKQVKDSQTQFAIYSIKANAFINLTKQ